MKASLREQLRARPHTRLLFVRRPDRRGRSELRAYAATSREGEESLSGLRFESYDELRHLDLAAAGEPLEHPLFLVCTHGKHDPCCARHGRPLYESLAEQLDEGWVWQSTHVGGDRFAGNLVCLPHGIYYGRVEREDAVGVLDEHLAGRIALDRYRGRSALSFAAQAAEHDVRREEDLRGIGELRLEREEPGGRFVFVESSGRRHARRVEVELGPEDFLTCGAAVPHRPRVFSVGRS